MATADSSKARREPFITAMPADRRMAKWLVGLGPTGLACIMGTAILALCPGCHRDPPDLTACTRIEVHYTRGALDYFFGYTPMLDRMLAEEEQQGVRSFDQWTVTDREQIKAFAERIRQGRDGGMAPGNPLAIPVAITCYEGTRRVASFRIYSPGDTVIANGHLYSYPPGLPALRYLDPPALKSLIARWECGVRLSILSWRGGLALPARPPHPDPNSWCDTIVQSTRRMHTTDTRQDGERRRTYSDSAIARGFACPSRTPADTNGVDSPADENEPPQNWVSDYAMNSNCRADSPDDTVLLFESQPGWNQHGGSELFTFDNHDPKGGCVLLNDGTVRFIRTEEELHALRWE